MGTRKRWVAVAPPAVAAGVALALAGGRADAHPHGLVAQGSVRLENGTADVPYYGYNGNGPLLPAPGDVPAQGHRVEAQKTEPDKTTYLRLRGLHGADPAYDYGTRFLFQGHEAGAGIHVSDGDPTTSGILGARDPHPFTAGWRLFWTQQHGDNTTWEITLNN
jgi:hypothetical protein